MNINSNYAGTFASAVDFVSAGNVAKDPSLIYKTPHYQGYCFSCHHPAHQCCCHVRTCRKEPKELLVVPGTTAALKQSGIAEFSPAAGNAAMELMMAESAARMKTGIVDEAKAAVAKEKEAIEMNRAPVSGKGMSIIGGCCCAHLSIEYMPAISKGSVSANPVVLVYVVDSEGTVLSWGKTIKPESIYQIKENIIATKPGAELIVVVHNMVARVRWCEIFSC